MAKGRGRDTTDIASSPSFDRLLFRPLVPQVPFSQTPLVLREVEDLREFHPSGPYRPARLFSGYPARARVGLSRSRRLTPAIGFYQARQVVICARRKERREALFASGRAGRIKPRRPRRTMWSDVHC